MTRFGYAAISQLAGLTTNHNCQLKSATPEKLRGLIAQNLADLTAILAHNLEHGWLAFRVGSSVIPFASHPVNQLAWWHEFAAPMREIGQFVRDNGMRLSMHPGQYTILNSPNETTRQAALAELVYSARFLEALGLDTQHDIVLHIGGVYGDKPAATTRFVEAAKNLPNSVFSRLAIEHEERGYNLAEVLAISAQTGLPVIYDNLHDHINPSPQTAAELLPSVFATWDGSRGVPETHFSSQAEGARTGSHAQFVDVTEFRTVLSMLTAVGEFDLILEAKGKDAALEQVLAAVSRTPVIPS